MGPDRSQWRTASAYAFLDGLDADGLAWECLRRNPDYQKDVADSLTEQAPDERLDAEVRDRWGLRFRGLAECRALVPAHGSDAELAKGQRAALRLGQVYEGS